MAVIDKQGNKHRESGAGGGGQFDGRAHPKSGVVLGSADLAHEFADQLSAAFPSVDDDLLDDATRVALDCLRGDGSLYEQDHDARSADVEKLNDLVLEFAESNDMLAGLDDDAQDQRLDDATHAAAAVVFPRRAVMSASDDVFVDDGPDEDTIVATANLLEQRYADEYDRDPDEITDLALAKRMLAEVTYSQASAAATGDLMDSGCPASVAQQFASTFPYRHEHFGSHRDPADWNEQFYSVAADGSRSAADPVSLADMKKVHRIDTTRASLGDGASVESYVELRDGRFAVAHYSGDSTGSYMRDVRVGIFTDRAMADLEYMGFGDNAWSADS